MFPGGIGPRRAGTGLRDPRSQRRDLGHPSISPFDIAEGTSFVISLPTRFSESAAPTARSTASRDRRGRRDDKRDERRLHGKWLVFERR